MKNKKTNLLVDMSPILYGNTFSATNYIKKDKSVKVKKIEGKWNLDQYKDIIIQKIIEEISGLKNKFNLSKEDDIILAFDNSNNGYWRKDVWAGYKSKRKKSRDESDIQWDKAFELFQELKEVLDKCSDTKVVDVPRAEGDDIIFVLSEYFDKNNENVIIYSSDHDFLQCCTENVQFWKTTRTQGMENSTFCDVNKEDVKEIIKEHIISGDPNDGFYHLKSYTKFSPLFLEKYPQLEGKEISAYSKRFQIEMAFKEKYGEDAEAYKHPRFGYKMLKRSKKTLKDILKENKIHKMNYEMNKKLALPENIPDDIKNEIINSYKKYHNLSDFNCFSNFLLKYRLFELSSLIVNL